MDYFANSTEHLFAELERIDLLIQAQVNKVRKINIEDEQFRGLYISELELDALLKQPMGQPRWYQANNSSDKTEPALKKLNRQIDLRKKNSLHQRVELRLDRLQHIFKLDAYEIDVMLICLSIELDLRYEKLYAYLQDDVTKKETKC